MGNKEKFRCCYLKSHKEELWWGFELCNETYQVLKYNGPMDIQEAQDNRAVIEIAGPVRATGRQDAVNKIVDLIRSRQGLI